MERVQFCKFVSSLGQLSETNNGRLDEHNAQKSCTFHGISLYQDQGLCFGSPFTVLGCEGRALIIPRVYEQAHELDPRGMARRVLRVLPLAAAA